MVFQSKSSMGCLWRRQNRFRIALPFERAIVDGAIGDARGRSANVACPAMACWAPARVTFLKGIVASCAIVPWSHSTVCAAGDSLALTWSMPAPIGGDCR